MVIPYLIFMESQSKPYSCHVPVQDTLKSSAHTTSTHYLRTKYSWFCSHRCSYGGQCHLLWFYIV